MTDEAELYGGARRLLVSPPMRRRGRLRCPDGSCSDVSVNVLSEIKQTEKRKKSKICRHDAGDVRMV